MNVPKIISLIFLLSLIACSSDYKFKLESPKKVKQGQSFSIKISEKENHPYDSVEFFIDGSAVAEKSLNDASSLEQFKKLGKHIISAKISIEGQTKSLTNEIYILAQDPPKILNFEIINTYPHDPKAFTQGLEYKDGFLYETTGQKGASSLRKVDIKTGEVIQQYDLDDRYFGEGMTIVGNKIFWLTWKAGKGFIFDLKSFEKLDEFNYQSSREGWGLTQNTDFLIKSDGSEKLWFLDKDEAKEHYFIEAYTDKRKVEKLNELELIKGDIYANIWGQNGITIVNPENGAVKAVINMTKLSSKIKKVNDVDQVLNGIAYDPENDRLFVTGKYWNKLFEIKIIE